MHFDIDRARNKTMKRMRMFRDHEQTEIRQLYKKKKI